MRKNKGNIFELCTQCAGMPLPDESINGRKAMKEYWNNGFLSEEK
jgi:hypothetical protein